MGMESENDEADDGKMVEQVVLCQIRIALVNLQLWMDLVVLPDTTILA